MRTWPPYFALCLCALIALALSLPGASAHRGGGTRGFCGCLSARQFWSDRPTPDEITPEPPLCWEPPPCEPETQTVTESVTEYLTSTETETETVTLTATETTTIVDVSFVYEPCPTTTMFPSSSETAASEEPTGSPATSPSPTTIVATSASSDSAIIESMSSSDSPDLSTSSSSPSVSPLFAVNTSELLIRRGRRFFLKH